MCFIHALCVCVFVRVRMCVFMMQKLDGDLRCQSQEGYLPWCLSQGLPHWLGASLLG